MRIQTRKDFFRLLQEEMMHWVVQQSIFKPGNYALLVDTLEAMGIAYTSVAIPNGTLELVPDLSIEGKVYVCGAIKLAEIAQGHRVRQWYIRQLPQLIS